MALVLYSVSLGGTFVYDDFDVFERDDRLADPSQWGRYWTESYNNGVDNLFRPLTSLSYATQWWLHGDRAWAFHLVNVLMNAGVCALVAELARRLFGFRAAVIAGLLFAAHPVHVEAVAYIVGRAELGCAAGMLGAIVLSLGRPVTLPRVNAIVLCCLTSILCKEQGLLAPVLVALALFLRTHRYSSAERESLKALAVVLCFAVGGYIAWREMHLKFWWDRVFLDWTINPMARSHGVDRLLMPVVLMGRYAALLVFPWKLSPDYGASVIGWSVAPSDPYLWIGLAAVALWVTAIVKCRSNRPMLFVLVAAALTYAMVGNIVALIGTNFGERLMYIPSAFLLIAAGALLSKLRFATPLVVFLVLLGSARTVTYALRWNDRPTFYEKSIVDQPKAVRLYMLLAADHMAEAERAEKRGDAKSARQYRDRAADVIARGIEQAPDYLMVWIESAVIAYHRGDLDKADADLNRSLAIKPTIPAAMWQQKVAARRAATQRSP